MTSVSSRLVSRIKDKRFLSCIKHSRNEYISDLLPQTPGRVLSLGLSGFTGVGCPKFVPLELVDHITKNSDLSDIQYDILCGGSANTFVMDEFCRNDLIRFQTPFQASRLNRQMINDNLIHYSDDHIGLFPTHMLRGYYNREHQNLSRDGIHSRRETSDDPPPPPLSQMGSLDVAIIEASGIDADGGIVLGAAVGATVEMVAKAKAVIIEMNTALPTEFSGMHDFDASTFCSAENSVIRSYMKLSGHLCTSGLGLRAMQGRVGTSSVKFDPTKLKAIVETSSTLDHTDGDGNASKELEAKIESMTKHIYDFLIHEENSGRLTLSALPSAAAPASTLRSFPPLQSGVGRIANGVMDRLVGQLSCGTNAADKNTGDVHNKRRELVVWSEVMADSIFKHIEDGNIAYGCTTALRLGEEAQGRLYENVAKYKERILLRDQATINNAAMISQLGLIAFNTPLEIDIFGHGNSSSVGGVKIMNGIGGSAEFTRHARISIMHAFSTRPTRSDPHGISTIVSKCPHVDHISLDLDVVVTEHGLSDLRGLTPREKARSIISNCAHPVYQPQLQEYFEQSIQSIGGFRPQSLETCFDMHTRLATHGTMRVRD